MEKKNAGTSSKNATSKVAQIRNLFKKQTTPLNGYLVTSYDQHISEQVAERDRRLQFMTGFTGHTGNAIITDTDAYLWADGRYHIQAEKEVQNPFRVMKSGCSGVPTELEWLIKHFHRGGVLGACGKYVPSSFWTSLADKLEDFNIKLIDVKDCLVDLIWKDQKGRPCTELVPQPKQFSGQIVADKIQDVRNIMSQHDVDTLVVTELDDIAWLLNLRGHDIPHNPVFFSFLIVRKNYIDIFVDYICECVNHFLFNEHIHLCDHEYDEFYDALHEMAEDNEIHKIWVSDKANQRVHHSIPKAKLFVWPSPISNAKCIKNNVEASGMIEAHVYDGHALCAFFCWVEKSVKSKTPPTELAAATKLEEIKKLNRDYIGPRSHYQCGTTDMTRTYHFGEATNFMKECYTRVFKGQVSLSTAVFPAGTRGSALDSLARQHLWRVGLDYNHETGHGVGAYLNVHEGPATISRNSTDDEGLKANMFLSNEPGYYEEDSFGIRLENVEHVVKVSRKPEDSHFLTFENITLVPYQTSMLVPSMLSSKEMQYLNTYHTRIRSILGPVFQSENNAEVYDWVMKMTEPLNLNATQGRAG
ncbi:hypothetical protein GE061_009580 [Apolygus lucorum]|uniref:Uncharacterized protein n=1 Tax=Apolygus lucorum TaxID=248454 RepID=A0A8S9Y0X3_APOLU|nr:hypothetical protein GE061_009580 [Apolygus lucorum]